MYSNCDTVELVLNGRSLGVHQPLTNETVWREFRQASDEIKYREQFSQEMLPGAALKHPPFVWDDVAYEEGRLVAVAHKGNETVRDEVRTAGAPVRLRVKAEKERLDVKREDVSFIEADVVDANGAIVPEAHPWVRFEVRGPGRLLGGSTEIDAITGVAAINVQTTGGAGEIVVSAAAPKLEPGSARILVPAK